MVAVAIAGGVETLDPCFAIRRLPWPDAVRKRSRRPTRTQQRSTSRASWPGSATSAAKVSSEPIELRASKGGTSR